MRRKISRSLSFSFQFGNIMRIPPKREFFLSFHSSMYTFFFEKESSRSIGVNRVKPATKSSFILSSSYYYSFLLFLSDFLFLLWPLQKNIPDLARSVTARWFVDYSQTFVAYSGIRSWRMCLSLSLWNNITSTHTVNVFVNRWKKQTKKRWKRDPSKKSPYATAVTA